MVGILIRLRQSILAHSADRVSAGWLIAAGVFALLTAGGTLWLGVVDYAKAGAGADLLAFVFALWIGGQAAQAAATGTGATLSPEMFALLPIRVRDLAWAFLVVGLVEPTTVILGVAFAALIALGAHGGLAAALIGVLAWLLTTLLASVISTLCANLLAPNGRRGRDLGTMLTAVLISLVALAGTLLPTLGGTLTGRTSTALTTIVRVLPSGWGPTAVDAAGRADWSQAGLALIGLALAVVAGAGALPWALARRMSARSSPSRKRHRSGRGRRLLPATPTGAVVGRELRLWARDPIRLTCLIIAAVVGIGVSVLPYVTAGTTTLLPFGGLLTIVIAGACACNLHGSDGTSIWMLVMTPGSARPDIRGRQIAWLLIVAPGGIALTLIGTAVSGHAWAWPWVAALLPSLLGGAAGLAVYASVHTVLPLDDSGGPTPAWSVKVHLAIYAVGLTGAPAALVLILARIEGMDALSWLAVAVGVLTGAAFGWHLAQAAIRRLDSHMVAILEQLSGGRASAVALVGTDRQ